MPTTVTGIYKQGNIRLLEEPPGVREGPVRVTLEEADGEIVSPRYLTRGKYKGGRMSTEEDFKLAEWHGDAEFGGG